MRELSFRDAVNEALREEMERDERVFLLGEDIGAFGGALKATRGLYEHFGARRVMDTPISESVIIGGALGAAMTGLRPVAEIMFFDFVAVCMDQIVNQVAKARYMLGGQVTVPLVIRTAFGADVSWAAQHSQSLESWFVYAPGLKVVMPATPYDAKGLLKAAIRDDNPVLFAENKLLYNTKGHVPESDYTVPLGVAEVKRTGTDVTLVAYSRMAVVALEVAAELEQEGISCEVVDLRTLKPMDTETIVRSVEKTCHLVTVEEGHRNLGIGAEVCARVTELAFDYLDAPPYRVAARNCPIPYSRPLETAVIPQKGDVAAAIRHVLGRA